MLPFHPLANLFPLIEGREFDDLVADVRAKGLIDEIVMLDGQILDGRNRYRAAVAAGLMDGEVDRLDNLAGGTVWFRPFYPATEGDPLAWVLSKNLHRRHLNASQLSMLAADLGKLKQGRPSEWRLPTAERAAPPPPSLPHQGGGEEGKAASLRDKPSLTQQQRADLVGVSERQVQTADFVKEHAAPEVVDAVRRGEVKVSAAAQLADLPISEQIAIMRSADPRAIGRMARERRAEQQLEKRERRDTRAADLAARHRALPVIKAGIIVADPAWKDEEVWSDATGMDRAADNHYPTMTLAEVMALDVGAIAADDAILFLYCKTNNLVEAICVAIAWGFAELVHDEAGHIVPGKSRRYVSEIAWDKVLIGNGRWVRDRHEHLLIFRRGNPVAPAPGTQLASVWTERRTDHSAKPVGILEWIERTWPDEIKIELNRRGAPRPGWHAWGNEVTATAEPSSVASGPATPSSSGTSEASQKNTETSERASNSDKSSPEAGPRAQVSHSQGTGAGTLADREAPHDGGAGSPDLPNHSLPTLRHTPTALGPDSHAKATEATPAPGPEAVGRQQDGVVSRPSRAGGSPAAVSGASSRPDERAGVASPGAPASRITFDEAKAILEARYRSTPGKVLAAELGVPVSTLRTWAQNLGLASVDRRREQLVARNKARAKGAEATQ